MKFNLRLLQKFSKKTFCCYANRKSAQSICKVLSLILKEPNFFQIINFVFKRKKNFSTEPKLKVAQNSQNIDIISHRYEQNIYKYFFVKKKNYFRNFSQVSIKTKMAWFYELKIDKNFEKKQTQFENKLQSSNCCPQIKKNQNPMQRQCDTFSENQILVLYQGFQNFNANKLKLPTQINLEAVQNSQ
eukprot:TRINITY_DN3222_c0_g1_i4.p2 TRINITY_DN3222_c0_g1~~TRINITY_DN3222_c0_g1_i4.p2  ORF type:complete len:187 (+),score=10.50 TRINITY_DN3222_c0_g1_i4:480-1040(+)